MTGVRVAPPAGPEDWDGDVRVSSDAFATGLAETRGWFAGSDAPGARVALVAKEGARVVAGAMACLGSQAFGGREVPAGAVGDVCVAPERRGRGLAREVMRALVGAMREAGALVSPLWPSTLRLDRGEGWEVAGAVHCRPPARGGSGAPASPSATRAPGSGPSTPARSAATTAPSSGRTLGGAGAGRTPPPRAPATSAGPRTAGRPG